MTQGERVRMLRKELGLTLEKFSERIGMKKNSISQIENNKNSLTNQTIKSICREFNVSYAWLIDGEGEMYENNIIFNLGNKLQELRISKGLTVRGLAEELNVSKSTISGWENSTRKPDYLMITTLAQYFNVSTDYLLGAEESNSVSNFGSKLQKLRLSKNMSQQELADDLGIGRSTLANYEQDKREPNFHLLKIISHYFNVSVDYLLEEKNILDIEEINILEKYKKMTSQEKQLVKDFFKFIENSRQQKDET